MKIESERKKKKELTMNILFNEFEGWDCKFIFILIFYRDVFLFIYLFILVTL